MISYTVYINEDVFIYIHVSLSFLKKKKHHTHFLSLLLASWFISSRFLNFYNIQVPFDQEIYLNI